MTTEDEVITKEELAELLQVSTRTVERWVEESRIPFIRLPKRGSKSNVRFLKSNVLQWLRKSESKPARSSL
jgi:excisionase family DNA binding protein